jgi:hypothetical protein
MKVWIIVVESGSCPSDCSWSIHSVYADEQAARAMAQALNDEERARCAKEREARPRYWTPLDSTDYEVQEHPVVDLP